MNDADRKFLTEWVGSVGIRRILMRRENATNVGKGFAKTFISNAPLTTGRTSGGSMKT